MVLLSCYHRRCLGTLLVAAGATAPFSLPELLIALCAAPIAEGFFADPARAKRAALSPLASARTRTPTPTPTPTARSADDGSAGDVLSSAGAAGPAPVDRSAASSLLRQWYPVALERSLDPRRPHGVELLGRKFVLFRSRVGDDSDGGGGEGVSWSCHDDRCPHRFAPLSEGRIVSAVNGDEDAGGSSIRGQRHIQCAYHGWEFDGCGSCQCIPQSTPSLETTTDRSTVRTYPVRMGGEMIWVWPHPDPLTHREAFNQQLPLSPLFLEFLEAYPGIGFQRDLPYGAELLGENLLDMSHLPFSHHTVGGLNRKFARPFQLNMLSKTERTELARSEYEWLGQRPPGRGAFSVPIIQANVLNATKSDPTLLSNQAMGLTMPRNSTSSSAFFAPCHVRYRRTMGRRRGVAVVELFWCPTSPGRCRVFLFNVLERFLPRMLERSVEEKRGWLARAKQRFVNSRIRVLVGGSTWQGHMAAHDIFDGDGIFLHKQGDRMRRDGLTYGDYYTPTSSDVLVNAYRRWLDAAAGATLETERGGTATVKRAAKAAVCAMVGASNEAGIDDPLFGEGGTYLDRNERSQMLDRYESHTKHCETCSKALVRLEIHRARWRTISAVLLGALGASGSVFSMSVALALFGGGSPFASVRTVLRTAATISAGASLGAYGANKKRAKVENAIKKFHFVDYVHSEKD